MVEPEDLSGLFSAIALKFNNMKEVDYMKNMMVLVYNEAADDMAGIIGKVNNDEVRKFLEKAVEKSAKNRKRNEKENEATSGCVIKTEYSKEFEDYFKSDECRKLFTTPALKEFVRQLVEYKF